MKTILPLPLSVAMACGLLAGCTAMPISSAEMQAELDPPPRHAEPEDVRYLPETAVRSDQADDGAVGEALELHRKLNEAMERLLANQKANRQLELRNQEMLKENEQLTKELAEARKELNEANEMLVMMREDLAEWKKNVLGYRSEMQQALVTILKSQQKVLSLLGAEGAGASLSYSNGSEGDRQ